VKANILGFIITGLLGGISFGDTEQPQVSFTQGSSGTWNADWNGVASRTYFVQGSIDLVHWDYLPVLEYGSGLKGAGIDTGSAAKYFIRLKFVDEAWVSTEQQARDADFDGDGIPNYYEVEQLGSDPLDKNSAGGDTDHDGLPDGWEKFYFSNLTSANPTAILQPDGLTNKEKADLGLDPTIDYSTATAAQSTKYAYDLAGRLTGVTAPVGAGTYTPDDAGNLLYAQ
jgi:YD repeat-containing protein